MSLKFKLQALPTDAGRVSIKFEATFSPSMARSLSTMVKSFSREDASIAAALDTIAADLMSAANKAELQTKN